MQVVPMTEKGVHLAPWRLLEVLLCSSILPGKHISTWVERARTFGIKYANNWVLFGTHSSFAHWNILSFLSTLPNFSSIYSNTLHEIEAVFASVTSTGFMDIGWKLWSWLLRCILLHFCLSWLVLYLLVSFSAHLKKIFPAQNKHCCATSWELIFGSLEGTGSSFTTLTRNKHAHLLAFWPLYWKS